MKQKGFTLLEVLLCAGIITVILGTATVFYASAFRHFSENQKTMTQLESLKRSFAYFQRDVVGSERMLYSTRGYRGSEKQIILQKPNSHIIIYAFEPARDKLKTKLVRRVLQGDTETDNKELLLNLKDGRFIVNNQLVTIEMALASRDKLFSSTVRFRLQ